MGSNVCCAATRRDQYQELIRNFETSHLMPLNRVSYRDFEERVKRLAFADHGEVLTMQQIEESFKD